MTRVDFYLLSCADPQERLQLICKLAEKAMGFGQKVCIHGKNPDELKILDDKLWDFRALSFAAHRLIETDADGVSGNEDPIHLSCGEPAIDRNVLINLDTVVPPFFSRFERTLEVVNRHPDIQRAGRERYLYYKQRGYPLQHHAM
jgi:DNA polymerase-3 subunit chi